MKLKEVFKPIFDSICFSYINNYTNKKYIILSGVTFEFVSGTVIHFFTNSNGYIKSFNSLTNDYHDFFEL